MSVRLSWRTGSGVVLVALGLVVGLAVLATAVADSGSTQAPPPGPPPLPKDALPPEPPLPSEAVIREVGHWKLATFPDGITLFLEVSSWEPPPGVVLTHKGEYTIIRLPDGTQLTVPGRVPLR